MTDLAIETIGLGRDFDGVEVLRGVDLAAGRGEILALLGSNGAGKTTTVNILATLLTPHRGTARICGLDVTEHPAQVRGKISLTGQFAAVDGLLTGRENLVLIARLRTVPEPGRAADELLARFGLSEAADRRAGTYSGGMTRRLDIAMSLLGSPEVIFLDEPTTGLDPQARLEVWRSIRHLADTGVTILLTTQYLEEAEQLADRVAVLHGGRIVAGGTVAELKNLLPPAQVEYVPRQPTLEQVFLALVGGDGGSR
ncbi:ABC transporter ATP-binding protein [Nakamurella deserti]|uniref:ABC transporter ATP-binding protein n=1 Tax=Nakamurella deserti TaxID=2164074 RepID=UPI000DBEA56B|nr:ATP-binding cassette domain-containing protein [Nakamurella deserti]